MMSGPAASRIIGRVASAARDRPDAAAAVVLAGVVAVFFWPLFVPGVWMPEGGGDNVGFLLPLFQAASDVLRSGRLPLWNPYLYCGSPMAADVQLGLFYPPNLAVMLLVPRVTHGLLQALCALHLWWAALGLYVCARRLRIGAAPIGRPAALLGAVAFGLSDVFVTHIGNANLVAAASWLPWSFVGLHQALHADGRAAAARWCALGAFAVGMAGLAGHPQPLAYILLLLVGYTVSTGVARVAGWGVGRSGPPPVRSLAAAPVIVLVGLGLAAVALVPAWELLALTRRVALDAAAGSEFSVAPSQLSGLFVPALFGRGMQRYWGPWPRVEAGYMGVVAVAFAVVAVMARLRRDRPAFRSSVGVLTVLVLAAYVLALGDITPAYGWLRQVLPALEGMRAPARFVLLADFGLALLASLGVDAFFTMSRERLASLLVQSLAVVLATMTALVVPAAMRAGRLIADMEVDAGDRARQAAAGGVMSVGVLSAVTCLAFLCHRGRLSARRTVAAVWVVALIELALAGAGLDRVGWDPTANLRPPAMAYLEGDSGLYRIEVRPEVWGWWSPGAAMAHQVQLVNGVYNPLQLADHQLYWESLTDRLGRKYDFLNAKYVVAPKDFALPWGKFAPVYDADEHIAIFLNTAAMPRATWVGQAVRVRDHEAAWAAIQDDGFDPTVQTVIEDRGSALAAGDTPSATGGRWGERADGPDAVDGVATAPGTVEVIHYRADNLEFVTDADTDGYLVVADAWYPGWRATVDGRDSSILRANYAFRAVRVPAGNHRVELEYRPISVVVGLGVSALAASAILGALVVGRKRPHRGMADSGGEAGGWDGPS